MSAPVRLRRMVEDRAQDERGFWVRCEAPAGAARCPNVAADVHHRLFTSRGGRVLDSLALDAWQMGVLEDFHLAHLWAVCRGCHDLAHRGDRQTALDRRLVVEGRVVAAEQGCPVWEGGYVGWGPLEVTA